MNEDPVWRPGDLVVMLYWKALNPGPPTMARTAPEPGSTETMAAVRPKSVLGTMSSRALRAAIWAPVLKVVEIFRPPPYSVARRSSSVRPRPYFGSASSCWRTSSAK